MKRQIRQYIRMSGLFKVPRIHTWRKLKPVGFKPVAFVMVKIIMEGRAVFRVINVMPEVPADIQNFLHGSARILPITMAEYFGKMGGILLIVKNAMAMTSLVA